MPRAKPAAEVERLIAMWREGASGKEIAEKLDWPSGTVATWVSRLQRSGVLCRRAGRRLVAPSAAIPARPLRAAVAAMPAEDREAREAELTGRPREVYFARRDGLTLAEIGALYSRSREWARQVEFAALVEVVGGEAAAKRLADAAPDIDDEIIRLSRMGRVAAHIAADLGIVANRVMRVLRRAGRDPASIRAQRAEEVMRRKAGGESHAEIAAALGVTEPTVTRLARVIGMAGRRRPRRTIDRCDRRRERVSLLAAAGLTTREIAEAIGASTSQVKRDRARIASAGSAQTTRAAVAAHPEMSAEDLAARLGVHPSTVRRHRRSAAEKEKE